MVGYPVKSTFTPWMRSGLSISAAGFTRIKARAGCCHSCSAKCDSGLTECFYVVAAQTFYVDPASGDQIHVLTNATGDRVSSATPGDSICLVAIDYTNWAAYSKSGTWADAN